MFLYPARLLFALFLAQNIVDAPLYFLYVLDLVSQKVKPCVQPVFVGGLLRLFLFPRRKWYLVPAVQHAFDVPLCRLV